MYIWKTDFVFFQCCPKFKAFVSLFVHSLVLFLGLNPGKGRGVDAVFSKLSWPQRGQREPELLVRINVL